MNPISYALKRNGHYGTHCAPLGIACINTTGPILECGCGYYSTPLLAALAGYMNRIVVTAESNQAWMKRFCHFADPLHQFKFVAVGNRNTYVHELSYRLFPRRRQRIDDGWNAVGGGRHWGLVFLDQVPAARRVKDLKRLRENSDVFVLHNTDPVNNAIYRFRPYVNTFRYVYEYPTLPSSIVCSDICDVRSFFV